MTLLPCLNPPLTAYFNKQEIYAPYSNFQELTWSALSFLCSFIFAPLPRTRWVHLAWRLGTSCQQRSLCKLLRSRAFNDPFFLQFRCQLQNHLFWEICPDNSIKIIPLSSSLVLFYGNIFFFSWPLPLLETVLVIYMSVVWLPTI